MKKILLSVLLIICLLVALVACVDPEGTPDGETYEPQTSSSSTGSSTTTPGGGPQLGEGDPEGGGFGPFVPAQ